MWMSIWGLLQSPVQALLRPSMWIPKIRNIHCHQERWSFEKEKGTEQIQRAILEGLKRLIKDDDRTFYDVHKISSDGTFLRIFAFTRAEWLDVMEFHINGQSVKVDCFSTGVFPLIIPFAVILNCVFFWVPFWDNNYNKIRTCALREAMEIEVKVIDD